MERETRLQLKPFRPVSEHIDGAWWPRSNSLVDELPSLAASVSERLGPIAIVGYRRNGWDPTPSLAEIGGRTVELLGFTSDEPTSVILIGEDGHHITLHVIPPDVDEDCGQKALDDARAYADRDMASASRSLVARSVADVADKLARHEGRDDDQRVAQIRRWCEEAAQQFADAPVQTFVPILVEHIVRNRMIESRIASPPPVG
ncbi:hypothetical protein B1T49_20295 [Mycobacterium persicum]|uniref:DUF5994 family protein n=1 Tax=Mycobacterium persicum TaxID=1487726 RepID=UPI000A0E871C|nr:DUF5994 family protein [Mycobacterium persicum]ORB91185.1 hypothetical protein B1T49_20295 [Mycobacterium persicum]